MIEEEEMGGSCVGDRRYLDVDVRVYVCVVLCCLRVHVREKSPKAQGDNDQELGSPATSSVIVESDWQMTIKL